jgi:hypothetical protein
MGGPSAQAGGPLLLVRMHPEVRRDLSRLGQFERRRSRAWGAGYLSLHTRAGLRRSARFAVIGLMISTRSSHPLQLPVIPEANGNRISRDGALPVNRIRLAEEL